MSSCDRHVVNWILLLAIAFQFKIHKHSVNMAIILLNKTYKKYHKHATNPMVKSHCFLLRDLFRR